MPILIDFSGTIHAAVHVDIRNHQDVSKEFLRHIIINQIKSVRKKFHNEYGEPIICMDSKVGYWRKEFFPFYKAKRKIAREASDIDWGMIFSYVNEIAKEIADNLPYKVIYVDKAEADDIIGTLAYQQPWNKDSLFEGEGEKCLIVSNDHDFKQLHGINGVTQYFPFAQKIARVEYPKLFLIEHILKGDPGDGIPNVRSSRDVFMTENTRQKPVSKKYIKDYIITGIIPESDEKRLIENVKLIDLQMVPEEIKGRILDAYNNAPCGNRSKLLAYFASKGLNNHLENINDF